MPRRRSAERPVGYPDSYETALRLADGRRVSVRPILPSDAPELAEAIRTADPETLHARFLGGPPPLTEAVLDRLTRLDYSHRFALVARDRRGRGVAVARYTALPESAAGKRAAEVAVAVDPSWREVGLATELIRMLARRALESASPSSPRPSSRRTARWPSWHTRAMPALRSSRAWLNCRLD